MKYTITVNEVKGSGNGLRGFASVSFGDSFKVTNIAIMENSETSKLFVTMPRYKTNEKDENQNDIYQDICNPITKEFREKLYNSILEIHQQERKKRMEAASEKPLNRREQIQQEERKEKEKGQTEQKSKKCGRK